MVEDGETEEEERERGVVVARGLARAAEGGPRAHAGELLLSLRARARRGVARARCACPPVASMARAQGARRVRAHGRRKREGGRGTRAERETEEGVGCCFLLPRRSSSSGRARPQKKPHLSADHDDARQLVGQQAAGRPSRVSELRANLAEAVDEPDHALQALRGLACVWCRHLVAGVVCVCLCVLLLPLSVLMYRWW